MNLIPGLKLRASEEAEVLGMDDAEIGEFAYDYVELTRDVVNGDALIAEERDLDSEMEDGRSMTSKISSSEMRGGALSRGPPETTIGGSTTMVQSEKNGYPDDERALRGGPFGGRR